MTTGFKNTIWKNYQIVDEIGRGGMGVVYKARQLSPSRVVAIKFLQQSVSVSNKKRFLREMEIAAKLEHPSIPKVYDAGMEKNYKYLVMDYISGMPLNVYLKQNHLSQQQKIDIFMQVCSTIGYAHSHGVIHRDLKPSNIIVENTGKVFVIDFGLARHIEQEKFDLTKSGEVMGTPNYMSPEQIRGKRSLIDQQADVYALGAILYELLAEKVMIAGDNILAVACRIQDHDFPSLSEVKPDLDKNLHIICHKSTHFKKSLRYANVQALIDDMQIFIRGGKVRNIPPLKTLFVCIVVLLALLMIYSHGNSPQNIELNEQQKQHLRYFSQLLKDIRGGKDFSIEYIKSFTTQQKLEVAKALYQEENYAMAIQILSALSQKSSDVTYHLGMVYYQQHQYKKAQVYFEKLVAAQRNNAKYNYYLGVCYIHEKQPTPALQCFLIAVKDFVNDVALLEQIAVIYENSGDIDQAEMYWKRCARLAPRVSRYTTSLAKISMHRKKYYQAFVYVQKSFQLGTDIEAMELMYEIPYFEPRLRRLCYHTLIRKTTIERETKPYDLFASEWPKLEKRYQQSYISWQEGIKNSDKSIAKFLKPHYNKKIQPVITKALLSLRYSKTFNREISKAIQSFPSSSIDFFRRVKRRAQIKRTREMKNRIIYQLAYMQRNESWQFLDRVRSSFLIELLRKETNLFVKYLLAKGCMHIFGFKPVVQVAINPEEDSINRMICCALLRKHYLAANIDVFFDCSQIEKNITVGKQREFLQALIAQSMYVRHNIKRVDTSHRFENTKKLPAKEQELLMYLLQQESPKVSLCAARSIYGLLGQGIFSEIPRVKEVIVRAMQSPDLGIKSYAHQVFWGNLQFSSDEIFVLYKQALHDNIPHIREIALTYPEPFYQKIPQLFPEIRSCLQSTSPRVRFSAIAMWSFMPKHTRSIFDHPLYIEKQNTFTDLEHSYCILLFFFQLFKQSRHNKQRDFLLHALTFFKRLKEEMYTLPSTTQCMISYALSILGQHPSLIELAQVKDPQLLSYLLYELHQEIYANGIQTPLIQKRTPPEKKFIAKKFLYHHNNEVRMSAFTTYTTFASEKERTDIYNQALASKNVYIKRGVAEGLFLAFQNAWVLGSNAKKSLTAEDLSAQRPIDELLFKDFSNMKIFVKRLQKTSKVQFEQYKKWINNALNLVPENSQYIAVGSLFNKNSSHILQKAIDVSRKNGGYLEKIHELQLIHTLIAHNNYQKAHSILQSNQDIPIFLLANFGQVYCKLQRYTQALKMYEKNFLTRSSEFSPFQQIFSQHLKIVSIYSKLKEEKVAKTLLEYMYQLYRRQRYELGSVSKKQFMKHILQRYPSINVSLVE